MSDEQCHKLRDDEIIERLDWVLADIRRLQETAKHVHIGAINVANLSSIEFNIDRIKTELENRQGETAS